MFSLYHFFDAKEGRRKIYRMVEGGGVHTRSQTIYVVSQKQSGKSVVCVLCRGLLLGMV